jgi:hypothetical protein
MLFVHPSVPIRLSSSLQSADIEKFFHGNKCMVILPYARRL